MQVLAVHIKATLHQQLLVAGKGPDHSGPIGREKMTDQKGFFFGREVGSATLSIFEKEIADASGREFFELKQE